MSEPKTIDWSTVKHFKPQEFSEDPNMYARPGLIYDLDEFRDILQRNVYPSPAPGALARLDDAGSQHYCGGATLSNAVDVFCEGSSGKAWQLAVTCQLWGAVGLYIDTKYQGEPWPMFHLDRRRLDSHWLPVCLLWIRENGNYRYPQYMTGGMDYLYGILQHLMRTGR